MANNSALGIGADFSDLDNLQQLLANAREKPHALRAEALNRAAEKTRTDAAAIANSYPDPLDELGNNLQREGTPVFQRVFTTNRQGHFLHFGSPKTGAPRDWLHGPARRAADDLFEELSKAAEPW